MTASTISAISSRVGRLLVHLSVLDNPADYVLVRALGRTRALRFRSGLRLTCSPRNLQKVNTLIGLAYHGAPLVTTVNAPGIEWTFDPDLQAVVTHSGLRFSLNLLDSVVLAETFLGETHFNGYDLTGKLIVDVGANVGDTALYFAQKGAVVFACEPDPANFRILCDNIRMNPGLQGRIETIPYAVGRDGQVDFYAGRRSGSGMYSGSSRERIKVQSVSLSTLIRSIGIERPFLMKADCKGCEMDIVEDPAIALFERVEIEYTLAKTRGNPSRIMDCLRAKGFDRVRVFKHYASDRTLSESGMIRAEKSPTRADVIGPPETSES